jgi:hypothetical protein
MREFSVNPFLHPNIYIKAFLYVLFLTPKMIQLIPQFNLQNEDRNLVVKIVPSLSPMTASTIVAIQ